MIVPKSHKNALGTQKLIIILLNMASEGYVILSGLTNANQVYDSTKHCFRECVHYLFWVNHPIPIGIIQNIST